MLGGRPSPNPRYKLPSYKYPILPPLTTRTPDKSVGLLLGSEDKLVDVDVIEPELSKDFGENAPQEEGIAHEVYEGPGKEYLQESPELNKQVDSKKMIQRYFPEQAYFDKIFKIIQGKELKGTHIPITVKEIHVGYLISPYFKDICLYLALNKLPSSKATIRGTEC